MRVVISSGHGKKIRGASCDESWGLDEVDEASKVVESVATALRSVDVDVITYHDDVCTSQSENLNRIADFHNSQDAHDLGYFGALQRLRGDGQAHGHRGALRVARPARRSPTRWWTRSPTPASLINRGPKERTDLHFLNATDEPAILIETCFVDSKADADLYRENYDLICNAIAGAIAGEEIGDGIDRPEPSRPSRAARARRDVLFQAKGKCSYFGGPDDTGVSPSEGLAFIYDVEEAPHLFLPEQPQERQGWRAGSTRGCPTWPAGGTTTSRPRPCCRQRADGAGHCERHQRCRPSPADWGPHEDTGRVADLSPGLMEASGSRPTTLSR